MVISGRKYLLTLDETMCMDDGIQYRLVYGRVWLKNFEEYFGKQSRNHANIFLSIGEDEDGENNILIGFCRVNYAVPMDTPPPIVLSNPVTYYDADKKQPITIFAPNIYYVTK